MDRKKKREEEYEFEKSEIKTEIEEIKVPSCPVTTLKGRKVKCLESQCLWWDFVKVACKVLAK